MQIEDWLRENESLILPVWVRRVRHRGGLERRDASTTQELKHHTFLIYYDRLCNAVVSGMTEELDQMLHKLVDEHIQRNYDVRQILQFPLQLKSTIWRFLFQDFSSTEAQEMMEQAERMLDHSVSVLVEVYTQVTQAALNEQLEASEFLATRLAIAGEETEKALMQLRSLYAISKTLGDRQQILQSIVDNLVYLPSIDFCVIWHIVVEDGLQVGAARGEIEENLAEITLSLDPPASFVSRALVHRRRQHLEADGDVLASVLTRTDVMAVPMLYEDRPVGVIMTNSQSQNEPLDSSVISLIQFASEQAAIALENARLYDQVTSFNQELEEKVLQRTDELEQANAELARVNRDLERLDRTKSDFISIAAHELKTPLTLIQGYTNIMRDDATVKNNPFLSNLLQGIIKGGQRLYDIVESMIDVSMIDTQVLQLRPTKTSLSNLVQTLNTQYANSFQERRITLVVGDLEKLPYIEADTKRLFQVIENLVVNAIKYTPDGGRIEIDGWVLDESLDEQWVEWIVRDTGIGINPQDHERIFDKFYQTGELALHSSGKTKFKGGGPGLGLAIAKGIVQAHGGRIWVESEGYDEEHCPGSCFHVVLPTRSKVTIPNIVSPFSYGKSE